MHIQVIDAEIQIPKPEHHAVEKKKELFHKYMMSACRYMSARAALIFKMTVMSPISANETVCVSVSVCLCADLLVVKNPGGSLALELLLLQDALKVLHALL